MMNLSPDGATGSVDELGRLLRPGHGVRGDPAGGVAPRRGMGRLRLPDCCRLALFVPRAGPLLSGAPLAAAGEPDGERGGAMMAVEREAMP